MKRIIFSILFTVIALTSLSAQVLPISISNIADQGQYVLLTFTETNSFNDKLEKVAFDPLKMDSYAKWRFHGISYSTSDGTLHRLVSIQNVTTGEYIDGGGNSPKYISEEKYKELWSKDENGNDKYGWDKVRSTCFYPAMQNHEKYGQFIEFQIIKGDMKKEWRLGSYKLVLVNKKK